MGDLAQPNIRTILDPLPIDKSVKANAWDAFHGATTPADFQSKFDGLPLARETKAALWDAKFGVQAPTTQGPQKGSDLLPHPAVVDQQATAIARQVAAPLAYGGLMQSLWDKVGEGAVGHAVEQAFPEGSPLRKILPTPSMTRESEQVQPDVRREILPLEAGMKPGALRGAAEFAASLTTPENLLLMVGTSGLGTLEKQLGKGLVSRLVSAGFSAQMLKDAIQQVPELRDSWQKEDWPHVRQYLVRIGLGAGMAGMSARHAVKAEPGAASQPKAADAGPQYTITGQPIRQESTNVTQRPTQPGASQAQPQSSPAAQGESAGGTQPGVRSSGPAEQPPSAAAAARPVENENSGEYFRGDWDVKLNADGQRQAAEGAARTAGQFDEIRSGTKDRHVETARAYAGANPQAGEVKTSQAYDPMHMGVHEGEPITPERIAAVNEHVRNRPDEPIPGTGKFSGSPGEKPAEWSGRLIGGVQDAMAGWEPGKKTLIVTSGRDVQAVRAWAANGMPADRSVDPDVLTSEWKTQPGGMMRLDPRTGQVEDVDTADKDGIYFARHGETDANANAAVPVEIAGQAPAAADQGTGPHGPVFREYSGKPAEAVAKLRQERTGEVPKVWHNDDLARATGTDGWIDLVWGNERGGLAHIVGKHVEGRKDLRLEDLATMIPDMRVTANDGRTADIASAGHKAAVRLDYDGAAKRWLVSAYEKAPPTGGSPFVPGAPESGSHPLPGGAGSAPGGESSPRSAAPGTSITPPAAEVNAGPHLPPAAEGLLKPEEQTALKEFWAEEKGTSLVGAILRADVKRTLELKAARDAGLEALEKAKGTPQEREYGNKLVQYYTGERDMWTGRVNQVLDRLRKSVRDPVDQEALAIMRDFKGRPGELQAWLAGTHPNLAILDDPARATAMANIEKLRPAMERAMNPTPAMLTADGVLTRIAEASLAEGKRLGFIDRGMASERYFTHLLWPRGEGLAPVSLSERVGKALGHRIGREYPMNQRREYPTLLDAIAANVKPKTLNAFTAATIHGEKFAVARATHLLIDELETAGAGKWFATSDRRIPEGWMAAARHSDLFTSVGQYVDPNTGEPVLAQQMLYVPQTIDRALRPITDPDYLDRMHGFRWWRASQAYLKSVQLGLSGFHAVTENYMALANMGPRGWIKGLRAHRDSGEFLQAERDLIRHGGTTSILGRSVEAYKALQPGSIPTWSDIVRSTTPIRVVDTLAQQITDFTFDKLQRQFKVTDYALHKAAWLADHPEASAEEQSAAMASIAKEVNAVYGGLNWERLGINHQSTEVARALMLAPDWTISNIFNLKYTLERGTPAGKLARAFWIRAAVGGLIGTQFASLFFTRLNGRAELSPRLLHPRGFDQEFQALTNAYMGHDRDGREVYQNIFFKGAPGDAVNLVNNINNYGGVQGIARSMIGKAAPYLRTGLELAVNENYLGRELIPKGMNPIASTVRGGYEFGKGVFPTPLSVSNLWEMVAGPEAGKYRPPEWFTTAFAGNPPRHLAPEGMHMTKHGLAPSHEKPRQSIWEEIRTGKR